MSYDTLWVEGTIRVCCEVIGWLFPGRYYHQLRRNVLLQLADEGLKQETKECI